MHCLVMQLGLGLLWRFDYVLWINGITLQKIISLHKWFYEVDCDYYTPSIICMIIKTYINVSFYGEFIIVLIDANMSPITVYLSCACHTQHRINPKCHHMLTNKNSRKGDEYWRSKNQPKKESRWHLLFSPKIFLLYNHNGEFVVNCWQYSYNPITHCIIGLVKQMEIRTKIHFVPYNIMCLPCIIFRLGLVNSYSESIF